MGGDLPTPERLLNVDGLVLLYDGTCRLCHGAVGFIRARDRDARFRFVPLQSDEGRAYLHACDRSATPCDSVVLLDGGRAYDGSTAMLRAARSLRGVWRVCGILLLVPRPVRDWAYGAIARRRYRWFGRLESGTTDPVSTGAADAAAGHVEKGTAALR